MTWSAIGTFLYGVAVEVIYQITRPFLHFIHRRPR